MRPTPATTATARPRGEPREVKGPARAPRPAGGPDARRGARGGSGGSMRRSRAHACFGVSLADGDEAAKSSVGGLRTGRVDRLVLTARRLDAPGHAGGDIE